MDTDHDGILDKNELYDGLRHLSRKVGVINPRHPFVYTRAECTDTVRLVPKLDSSVPHCLTCNDFVHFASGPSSHRAGIVAHRKLQSALKLWLTMKRLKRYKVTDYERKAAAFYVVSAKSERHGKISAEGLVAVYERLGRGGQLSLERAKALCNKHGDVHAYLDIDAFLRICPSVRVLSLNRFLRLRSRRADHATLARIFWQYDVESFGEIDGEQMSLALGELARVEQTIEAQRVNQMFDVTGCNTPLLFYDLPLFELVIAKLRKIKTKAGAATLHRFIAHHYVKRDKPVPMTKQPPARLGDLNHMIGLNLRLSKKYEKDTAKKCGPPGSAPNADSKDAPKL